LGRMGVASEGEGLKKPFSLSALLIEGTAPQRLWRSLRLQV